VVAHAVEPWGGGVIPEWWVAPEAGREAGAVAAPTDVVSALLAHPVSDRTLPHAEAGALVSIQTRTGTYRFLRSGADPIELGARVGEFSVRHRGPAGVSTVTTVAPRQREPRTGWARVRPFLVVLLVAVVVAMVTVILLQSAGVIHLPVLGGGASGAGALRRSPGT